MQVLSKLLKSRKKEKNMRKCQLALFPYADLERINQVAQSVNVNVDATSGCNKQEVAIAS